MCNVIYETKGKAREYCELSANPLRFCSCSENTRNRGKLSTNTSSFPGVSYNIRRRKYRALIMINGESKHLGYFETPEEAFIAYRAANLEGFGSFPPSVTRDEFKAWSDRVETLKLIFPNEGGSK